MTARARVKHYLLDDKAIIIPHVVGSTKIPFEKIDYASVDDLGSHYDVVRKPKGKTERRIHYTDSSGGTVKVSGGILSLGDPPYVTTHSGECLLVRLKGGVCIALTPNDPTSMANAINGARGTLSDKAAGKNLSSEQIKDNPGVTNESK